MAGPIERATNLLIQFERPRSFEYNDAVDGIRQMMWGFSEKILSDNAGMSEFEYLSDCQVIFAL